MLEQEYSVAQLEYHPENREILHRNVLGQEYLVSQLEYHPENREIQHKNIQLLNWNIIQRRETYSIEM